MAWLGKAACGHDKFNLNYKDGDKAEIQYHHVNGS